MVDRSINIKLAATGDNAVRRQFQSLGADGEAALRKIESAGMATSRSMALMDRTASSLRGAIGGFVAGIGIEQTARSIMNAVQSVAKLADEAKRAGLSAEDLQALQYAAEQSGFEADRASELFQKLNKTVGEAATKGNYLTEILKANGIALRDQNGDLRDQKQLFYEIVDLIANAKSVQEATVIATTAFTKAAEDAVPFLRQGSAALKEGEKAARDAGAVISNELVAKADEFDDRWAASWRTFSATAKSNVLEAMKWFDELDATANRNQRKVEEDQARGQGPNSHVQELIAQRDLVQSFIVGLSDAPGDRLEHWRQELERINKELALAGPGFERLGHSSGAYTLPGVSRNPFDTGRGVILPTDSGDGGGSTGSGTRRTGSSASQLLGGGGGSDTLGEFERSVRGTTDALADGSDQLYEFDDAMERTIAITDASREGFTSLFGDLARGIEPLNAITDAIGRMGQRLADIGIGAVSDVLFGKSGTQLGGVIGDLFSGAPATAAAPVAVNSVLNIGGGVSKPEFRAMLDDRDRNLRRDLPRLVKDARVKAKL